MGLAKPNCVPPTIDMSTEPRSQAVALTSAGCPAKLAV